MARTSWFDDKAQHPIIQEQINKLESFTSALADGVVSQAGARRTGAAARGRDEDRSSRRSATSCTPR